MNRYFLYSYPICPFCRKIRFFMDECSIPYKNIETKVWKRDLDFIKLNPANTVPVVYDNTNSIALCESFLISRYLADVEDSIEDFDLMHQFVGEDLFSSLEIARLEFWFDRKFYNEVSKHILNEKVYDRYIDPQSKPKIENLKIAQYNLDIHMEYIEFLLMTRKYLAGEKFSMADISAATQLSVLDYFGNVPWNKYLEAKNWYAAIKSKKGFKGILKDKVDGYMPFKDYDNLDF